MIGMYRDACIGYGALTACQSPSGRVAEMGHILHRQPPVQDIFQVEFSVHLKNYSQDACGI